MEIVVERQWRAKNTFIVATLAWGDGIIPVDPDQSEGPFVLPLRPLLNSRYFQVSCAPRWLDRISPELGPVLDSHWRSLGTTLYHSTDFTLVQETFSIWAGKRAPVLARFFKGEAELGGIMEKVEAIGLPERVRFRQLAPWWFDRKFQRRFLIVGLLALVLLQLGIIVYANVP